MPLRTERLHRFKNTFGSRCCGRRAARRSGPGTDASRPARPAPAPPGSPRLPGARRCPPAARPPRYPVPESSQAQLPRASTAHTTAFPQARVTRLQRSPPRCSARVLCKALSGLSRQGCEAQGALNRQKGSRHCQTPGSKGTERGRGYTEPGVSSNEGAATSQR